MIKHINHQNFQTTPFVAAKNWRLFNVESDDLVILELTSSEDTVALEFIDYSTNSPFVNTECSIALEQQGNDRIIYQEGTTGSGAFFPSSEPTNRDGTFKRLVHSQVKSTFYNKFNNPTKIFGMEFIDFPLGNTFREISDFVRIFTVPRNIFGERVIENTVHLEDNSLDDNVEITDDGYQNLIAKSNLFSKVQEVRSFGNIIMSGTSSFCAVLPVPPSDLTVVSGSAILTWDDNSTNENGFVVERSTNSGSTYTFLQSVASNVTGTVDSTVTTPGTYYYRVYAFNLFGSSDFSNTASITFVPVDNIPNDSMESYTDGVVLDGLNGGHAGNHIYFIAWQSPYADRATQFGVQADDSMESYTDGAALNGLNGVYGFVGAYHDRTNFSGVKAYDSMESYTDGAALNGLNGGTGFASAYTNHNN